MLLRHQVALRLRLCLLFVVCGSVESVLSACFSDRSALAAAGANPANIRNIKERIYLFFKVGSFGFIILNLSVFEGDHPFGPLHDHIVMGGEQKSHTGFFVQLPHHIQ